MNDAAELTPKARLAASRKALVHYMNHDENTPESDGSSMDDGMQGYGEATSSGTWANIKHAAKIWWQHHPAQLALKLAQPALDRYAAEKPLQLLGIAAGVGAAAVIIRPWRLISVTGLLFAAIKASDAPVLLMSILSSRHQPTTTNRDSP